MSLKGLKINIDLHRRLKRLAADSGSIQRITEEALEAHLSALENGTLASLVPVPMTIHTNKESDSMPSQVNPGHKWERARRQLSKIENSTDDEAQKAILSNLSVFSRKLQSASRERKNPPVSTKRAKAGVLGKVPGTLSRADRALAKENNAPEVISGNRTDHNGSQPGDPGSRKSGSGGSKS